MEWLKSIKDTDPNELMCTHPDRGEKKFTPEKAEKVCKRYKRGPCVFLQEKRAFDGREGEKVSPTRRTRRVFPGE